MNLIDYDAQFEEFFEKWYDNNRTKYPKPEDAEEIMPQVYRAWSAGVCAELMNMQPQELVQLINEYISQGKNVPDVVCDTIVRRKAECEQELFDLYSCNMFSTDGQVLLINMLAEMNSSLAVPSFVRLVAAAGDDSEIAEAASEALQLCDTDFLEAGIAALNSAKTLSARELLINALIAHYKDERLLAPLLQLFNQSPNKAFVAAMMGEYGNDSCLDVLKAAQYDKAINYLEYTEICNAIEALGGETPRDREFEGDEYYDMMAQGDIEG